MVGVLAALAGIIGLNPFEASDYARFIPGRRFWRTSVVSVVLPYAAMFFVAYPLGMLFTIATGGATDPAVYFPTLLGLGFGVLLAWVSQVRINLTSIHLGSIALTSVGERVLPWRVGRRVWTVVICVATMSLMFGDVLGNVLVFLDWNGVFLFAWAGSIVADLLVVRRWLKIVPRAIEYRETHIRNVNPVGVTALLAASAIGSVLLAAGGPVISGLSAYIALFIAAVIHVLLAHITNGKYYVTEESSGKESAKGGMTLRVDTT